jgi:Uma2 family endonuclease
MAMRERREATVEDLERIEGKAELVGGRIVLMPPSGGLHGLASAAIVAGLREHVARTGVGVALPDNVGFIVDLPGRKSFSPDAAFYVGPLTMGFVRGAPLFAVEVRSIGDYGPAAERRLAAKRADYFAAGTLVVWDVDLVGDDVVRVFRASAPDTPTIRRAGDVADAEPAVPGWRFAVDALRLP